MITRRALSHKLSFTILYDHQLSIISQIIIYNTLLSPTERYLTKLSYIIPQIISYNTRSYNTISYNILFYSIEFNYKTFQNHLLNSKILSP